MDSVYKALADKNRRKILEILKTGDMTVSEISEHFSFSGATLSHHLSVLKHASLVYSERDGQFIRYSRNATVLRELTQTFSDMTKKSQIV